MADLDLSEQAAGMHALLVALVATLNTLQPEGYLDTFPAITFRPVKE